MQSALILSLYLNILVLAIVLCFGFLDFFLKYLLTFNCLDFPEALCIASHDKVIDATSCSYARTTKPNVEQRAEGGTELSSC